MIQPRPMQGLAGWDFPSRTSAALPTVLAQILFALLVTVVMIALRMVVDLISPGAGPLALVVPAVMIATLFARWLAGLLTLVATMLYTVYFIMPPANSFELNDADFARVVINSIVQIGSIVVLELFRAAVVRANAERDRQIEQGELLLRELDHRVKNNFAQVVNLLRLQGQRASEPVVRAELNSALNRVESLATVHRFLYRDGVPSGTIDMRAYLGQLCAALGSSLSDRIILRCEAEPALLPRGRAIPVAMIVNELVTNAARHAFPDDRAGSVTISFRRVDAGYELSVADDGCGISGEPREGGIGRRLIAAFVREADGELDTHSSPKGTICLIRLK